MKTPGVFVLALLLFIPVSGVTAQFRDFLGYRIHYTTFSSTIIPAEVAAQHNIVRADNRIVLNVSVVSNKDAEPSPAPALLRGQVMNLLNQQFDLEFDEVRESDAIYYLASHLALPQDILRFSLQVQPGDETDAVTIEFVRRYD